MKTFIEELTIGVLGWFRNLENIYPVEMLKVEVLKYNQIYLSTFGAYAKNLEKPSLLEFFESKFLYYAVVVLFFSLISSSLFFHDNLHEVKEALEAFKILAGGFQCATCGLVLGFQVKNSAALHLKLQKLVDECKYLIRYCFKFKSLL